MTDFVYYHFKCIIQSVIYLPSHLFPRLYSYKKQPSPLNQTMYSVLSLFLFSDRKFVIANAQIETNPIIFCNDGFCELSGYSRAEVMQKCCLCDFLHGPLTSSVGMLQIRDALQGSEEKQVEILYYRKEGT